MPDEDVGQSTALAPTAANVLPPPPGEPEPSAGEANHRAFLLAMNLSEVRIEAAIRIGREESRVALSQARERLARLSANLEEMFGHVHQRGWTDAAVVLLSVLLGMMLSLIVQHWADNRAYAVAWLTVSAVVAVVLATLMVGETVAVKRARRLQRELDGTPEGD